MKLFKSLQNRTPFYLKIIDLLKPYYERRGANFEQLKLIVETKMLMDKRSTHPMAEVFESEEDDKETNNFFSSLWFYGILSLFFITIFFYDSYMYQYVTYFSYLFVMLIATLVAQFSSVILDAKDQSIIETKPVSTVTSDLAKATHIGIYVIAFTLAIGFGPIIGSFIANGFLVGLLTVLLTGLAAIWCLILTLTGYAFILHRFDGERLKNMLAYFQIIFSVFMIMSYYIMSNIVEIIDLAALTTSYSLDLWHIFIFPLWFVAPFGLIQEGINLSLALLTGLLIIGTILLIIFYRSNSYRINQNLQKMNTSSQKGIKRSKWAKWFSKMLFISEREKPYYFFAWHLTKSDRNFKTRLYPSVATTLILPFVFIWTFFQNMDISALIEMDLFAYVPYLIVMVLPSITISMNFSPSPKAGWLFDIRPFQDSAEVYRGTYKAILIRLILPIYLIINLAVFIIFKGLDLLVLLNGFLMIAIIFFLNMYIGLRDLPFMEAYDAGKANLGCIAGVIIVTGMVVITGILWLIQTFLPFGKVILLILLTGINIYIHKIGFNKKKVKRI